MALSKRVSRHEDCWIERREPNPSACATKLTRRLPGVACSKLAAHLTSTEAPAGIERKKYVWPPGRLRVAHAFQVDRHVRQRLLDVLVKWAAIADCRSRYRRCRPAA